MTMVRRVLLVLFLVASCGTNDASDDSTDEHVASTEAAPTGSPPPEGGGSPPPKEGQGPETPRETDDGVAITAPGLPIGGDRPDSSHDEQCVIASLLTEIPAEMSITVTGIRFTDDGIFTTNGEGCEEVQACSGFTFTVDRTECSVLVYATARNGDFTNMRLDGVLRCDRANARTCQDFTWDEGSIPVEQPFEVPSKSPTTSTPSPGQSTAGGSTHPETTS